MADKLKNTNLLGRLLNGNKHQLRFQIDPITPLKKYKCFLNPQRLFFPLNNSLKTRKPGLRPVQLLVSGLGSVPSPSRSSALAAGLLEPRLMTCHPRGVQHHTRTLQGNLHGQNVWRPHPYGGQQRRTGRVFSVVSWLQRRNAS